MYNPKMSLEIVNLANDVLENRELIFQFITELTRLGAHMSALAFISGLSYSSFAKATHGDPENAVRDGLKVGALVGIITWLSTLNVVG
jgi:hypothetical protein